MRYQIAYSGNIRTRELCLFYSIIDFDNNDDIINNISNDDNDDDDDDNDDDDEYDDQLTSRAHTSNLNVMC